MTKINALLLLCMTSFIGYTQDFYDISNVNTIEIEFTESDWKDIMDQYYANDLDERLAGTCTINGEFFDSVGVKFKGNSTYNINNGKNPLNIKLDYVYNQSYQGYETLKLANGDKDPSFVREVLGYELGRKYMDMPLSNFAKIYINGNYYGLFCNTESINGDFMERRFYADGDNLRFKCNPNYGTGGNNGSSLEYLGADTTSYYDSYELKSTFGWTELMDLTYQLSVNVANIENYLDLDRAIWMLAYNNVIVNLDSYSGGIRQNYYLVKDDNGRVIPIIWDLNGCFGAFTAVYDLGGPPPMLTDLTDMEPLIHSTNPIWALIIQLYSVPRYRMMYIAHCKTIMEENLSNNWFYTRGQEIQTIIDADVQSDPNAFYTYSDFTTNLTSQVGGGPALKFGVAQVANGREAFLSTHALYTQLDPTISAITNTPAAPTAYNTVTFTANIIDANYAYLGYRSYKADAFVKTEMFDDGLHNDGAAGDDVWGVNIVLGASDIQYYIYAENANAAKFSPIRAEHEFYDITLTSGVVINEISALNYAIASDQDGEFDDWIEFYNNTASDVDLSSYYLSDDPTNPTKWTFPLGTTILANDYLIVWCDNDTTQAGLHANFKLASSGEIITFSDASGWNINELTCPDVGSNYTYGRYVNGTGGFIPMTATYNAENSFTAVGIEEEIISEINIDIYPNPSSDYVQIELSTDSEQLKIYNLNGQLLMTKSIAKQEMIDLSSFDSGVYLFVFENSTLTKKVIVRH